MEVDLLGKSPSQTEREQGERNGQVDTSVVTDVLYSPSLTHTYTHTQTTHTHIQSQFTSFSHLLTIPPLKRVNCLRQNIPPTSISHKSFKFNCIISESVTM